MLVAEVEEEEEAASRQLVVGISQFASSRGDAVLWWARGAGSLLSLTRGSIL